jgi:hypothetical protein
MRRLPKIVFGFVNGCAKQKKALFFSVLHALFGVREECTPIST